MESEKKTFNSVEPVNISEAKIILEQMTKCICKININRKLGTGFFCLIPYQDHKMSVFMTNYHLIDENYYKQSKEIILVLNDDIETRTINLKIKRETYFNKDYDITLIELKKEDNIKFGLELDDNLFKDEIKNFYQNISLYIIHYPNGKNASYSLGKLINF